MASLPTVTRSILSNARGCVGDVAQLAQRIPFFPVDRTMHLGPLAAARAATEVRIGWAALFLKAYALVADEMPVLRTWLVRSFLGGLVPQLANCSESVATLAVNRIEAGEDRLFFARLRRPNACSLVEIQKFISDCQSQPVATCFKRQLELERMPGFLRRQILYWNMNSFSRKRASRIGTFSLSTLSGLHATNRMHPTICTTSLTYAAIESDGRCLVTLLADHRVLDGMAVARALVRLEEVLTGQLMDEVLFLRKKHVASAPSSLPQKPSTGTTASV
ncbi:MAG: hypothetical protein NTY87_05050 [Planctomycetia bacterium]|nr:hypothetical protein [Planctomycetia bacterium]